MCLIAKSQRLDSFIQNLNYNYTFISHFSASYDLFEHSIPIIMSTLNSEKAILVFRDEYEKCENDEWIGIKDNKSKSKDWFTYQVFIYSKERAHSMIPEIKCPYFQHNFQDLLSQKDKYHHISSEMIVWPVLIIKDNGVIKYEQIKNLIYDAYPDENYKSIENKWKIKDWFWKPKIIGNIREYSLDRVYSAIEEGLVSSAVHDFRCDNLIQFTNKFYYDRKGNDYYFNNSKETKILQKMLKLLEINKDSSIKILLLFIDYYTMVKNSFGLRVKSQEFVLSFKGKIFKVKCDRPSTYIKGSIYFPDDEDSSIVIEWEVLRCSKMIITTEADSSLFKSEWYDKFLDTESQDKLDLFIVVKKADIIGFLYEHLDIINETWYYKNLEWIGLGAVINKVDKNCFFHILELLPKTIFLELNWTKDSWYLKDELFWTVVFNFKKIELKDYNNDWNVVINCQEEKLDKNDVMNSCINDSNGHWLRIKDIYQDFERAYNLKNYGYDSYFDFEDFWKI